MEQSSILNQSQLLEEKFFPAQTKVLCAVNRTNCQFAGDLLSLISVKFYTPKRFPTEEAKTFQFWTNKFCPHYNPVAVFDQYLICQHENSEFQTHATMVVLDIGLVRIEQEHYRGIRTFPDPFEEQEEDEMEEELILHQAPAHFQADPVEEIIVPRNYLDLTDDEKNVLDLTDSAYNY